MKEKGFTLIELLAVIVILAIIALIATPIILNIISDAKEQANKRSIENYAKAIKNAVVTSQLSDNTGIVGSYDTATVESKLKIEYDGPKVECEIIKIYKYGTIYLTDCSVNKEPVDYYYGKLPTYKNGEVIYFDVKNGKGCTEEEYKNSYDEDLKDYLNSKTGYNGLNGTGNQTGCLKFYAFNDDGKETLNLLLDHNTKSKNAWINQTDFNDAEGIITDDLKQNDGYCRFNNDCLGNNVGPISALKQLYEDTKDWKGTITPLEYTLNQSNQISQANYTIDYSRYKARLITAQEIAKIIGADKKEDIMFDEKSNEAYTTIYFHNLSSYEENCANIGCKYGWLYDRTNGNCKDYGCLNSSDEQPTEYWNSTGYWTATSVNSNSFTAWFVANRGCISDGGFHGLGFGIRPTINVYKIDI